MEESRVANQGSDTHDNIAIRSDHKSYSYNQLISSASRISRLLSTGEFIAVSFSLNIYYFPLLLPPPPPPSSPSEQYFSLIFGVFGVQTSSALIDGGKGQGHLGGARIGIVAKPSAEFVAGILGTWLCGGVAVPLALGYPEAELLHVINDSVSPHIPVFLLFRL